MKRQNVTLVVEEDLLKEARIVAARRHTSVNELFRQFLSQLVGQEERRVAAWNRIKGWVDRRPVRIGDRLPGRDELHER